MCFNATKRNAVGRGTPPKAFCRLKNYMSSRGGRKSDVAIHCPINVWIATPTARNDVKVGRMEREDAEGWKARQFFFVKKNWTARKQNIIFSLHIFIHLLLFAL